MKLHCIYIYLIRLFLHFIFLLILAHLNYFQIISFILPQTLLKQIIGYFFVIIFILFEYSPDFKYISVYIFILLQIGLFFIVYSYEL